MAGIIGYFSQNVNRNIVNNIQSVIMDEGYYITDLIIDNSCVLGKLDIEPAKVIEAMTNKEVKISIVTCGEVYNEDIKTMDKSIIEFYEEEKLDKLKDFNGAFAAAIFDKREEKLTLVNDRHGLIKLFYYHDDDHFCFAPKIRPLLRRGAKKVLRTDAFIDFFLFGYFLGNKTPFEHVYQLPPATILEVSKDKVRLTKYWDYDYNKAYDTRPQEELIEDLGRLWQKAVERRIKKDETIIIPLSGGLDSRAILAAALECTSKDKIITFTFGERGSFDFEIGKMVALEASVKNVPLEVEKLNFWRQYDISFADVEGMIDVTPYFPVEGYKSLKGYGSTIYTGYMGGELMGPLIFSKVLNKKLKNEEDYFEAENIIFNQYKLNKLEDIQRLLNLAYINKDIRSSFKETVIDITKIKEKDLPNYCASWLYKHEDYKYISFCVFRYKNLFKFITPFLDNDLVDFMLKVPPELRLNKTLYKSMLLKRYPDLFKLPTRNNLGLGLNTSKTLLFLKKATSFLKRKANEASSMLIKRNIFFNKATNYIDYDDLLRRDKKYRNYMGEMIAKVKERPYFNREYIEEIWIQHMNGKKNYSRLLGLLATFELLLENFIESNECIGCIKQKEFINKT